MRARTTQAGARGRPHGRIGVDKGIVATSARDQRATAPAGRKRRLAEAGQNLALAIASLALCFAVLEFAVFRTVLKPDDVLPNVSINGVVRYLPGTRAIFRHPDGRETAISINADGWNSTKANYRRERTPGRLRIAVVGDSYVHGAFIDTRDGFPEVLEASLAEAGLDAEVYRFGMDGAPLSQYLHMLRREVRHYRPDIVVVQLIHNDFDETYRFLKTRTGSSFLKIGRDASGRPEEVEPVDFRPGLADVMRNSAAFRYLYYETNAYLALKGLISRFYWGGGEEWRPEFVSSAVDIRNIKDHAQNRFFARYVMAEMKALAEADGFKLAFAMDGVREAVYSGRPALDYEVGKLNSMAREVAGELGLPFLDLQETFSDDWARHKARLEYPYDWHWNLRGNRLVGEAIARMLLDDPGLLGSAPRRACCPS